MTIDLLPHGAFQGGANLAPSEEEGESLREILNSIIEVVNTLSGTPDLNEAVKVNGTDGLAEFLRDKLSVGIGLSLDVVDKGGGVLAIELSAPGATTDVAVAVTPTDTNPTQLLGKIVDADGNPLPVQNLGADEQLVLPRGGTGWIYIEDIRAPAGSQADQVYQDSGNTVLQSITVSDTALEVDVRSSYPLVNVGGVDAQLTRATGGGHFEGTVAVTIAGTGPIVATVKDPDGNDGSGDTCDITVELPPNITALSFTGGYPGAPQTELKQGDAFGVTVTADKAFDQVEVIDFEACESQIIPVASSTSAVVSATIADRGDTAVLRPARVRVRDSVTGAWSATRDTNALGGSVDGTDVVNCNNLHPTVNVGSVSYPATQQALKGSESATVANTASDFDSIAYDDPTAGELSIANPSTFEASKSVTRVGGTYNVGTPNFRITANRAANDATTVDTGVVNIAAVAATVTVIEPAARLRSGGNDGTAPQDHEITIASDQELLNAPSLDPDLGGSRGTFQGAGFVGGPATWTRDLRVTDSDEKGTFTWANLVATNLAGIVTTAISGDTSYTLGGFVARNLTFAAFATQVAMNVEVVDFSKLQAGIFTATNQPALKQAIGTPPPVVNGYTINALGVNPTNVIWLDTAAASTNSTGTAQITNVEEVI